MRIQLIEDNEDLQDIYVQLFESANHEVRTSSDGLKGITEMVDFQPDIVLLDIMMPEMDGYEFLHALRQNTSMHPFVIVLSNLSQKSDVKRALEAGAHTYLKKSDLIGNDLVKEVEKRYMEYLEIEHQKQNTQ